MIAAIKDNIIVKLVSLWDDFFILRYKPLILKTSSNLGEMGGYEIETVSACVSNSPLI